MHNDLQRVIEEEGLDVATDTSRHYSDVYVHCNDIAQAHRIKCAGLWSAMASVFTCNVTGKPSVDVPFGALDEHLKTS
jgi:hypothetical protein